MLTHGTTHKLRVSRLESKPALSADIDCIGLGKPLLHGLNRHEP